MAPRINLLDAAEKRRLMEHDEALSTATLPVWTCVQCGARHTGPREPRIDLCKPCAHAERDRRYRARQA